MREGKEGEREEPSRKRKWHVHSPVEGSNKVRVRDREKELREQGEQSPHLARAVGGTRTFTKSCRTLGEMSTELKNNGKP